METYVTFIWSMQFFCKLHRIDQSNMCINFENNRLTIENVHMTLTVDLYLTSITYKIVKISKWPWPLTSIWPWPWVWPLIWRNTFVQIGTFCLKSRDVKTWRRSQNGWSVTEAEFYKELLQPNRSLCHFRFKSYGPLSVFHKSGDLDLAFYPIFKKKVLHCHVSRRHLLSKNQDDRTIRAAFTAFEDGQTDKQTDRPRWPIYFRKSKSSKSNNNNIYTTKQGYY